MDELKPRSHWRENGCLREKDKHFNDRIAKSGIFENDGLTIGEQKNAIEKLYTLLLTEFCDMLRIAQFC